RYRDYIAWLQQRDKKADEAYWREQLAKLDGSTWLANALPVEESRQKASGYSEYRVTLDAMLTQRLEHLAREERVTVNTVIQAAWAVILQRYTGQRAVVFGATVSGRPTDLAGSQQLLGLFINTLPVVLAPRAEQTVGDWLREVQAQGLSMREHEHTPLNEIQRWAGAGGRGLFDTLVVYENYPVDAAFKEAAPAGLKFGEIASREETNYPLTITVMPAEKLRIDWTFAREHFGDEHVAALIERFERVLRQIGDDCGRAVGSLVIESPDEAAVLLAKGTCNEAYVDVMPVHERVAREVQAHPERVAVVYGETQLRYGELDAQANRLAQRLAKLGVGPEVRVGIAVERSVEMVVGLLAILKAGGAYVPLDPEYPRDRLAYMLEDSGVALLLTQSWVRERLPVAEGVTVLELDTLDVSAEPAVAPQISVHGDNLAYVIYTSGSTGRPKGAANRHSALSNRLAWMQSAYALEETDVVLQKTPFSFDVSVWEFFWPLMTGARLVVAEPGAHRDPQRLVELIRDHGVTTLHFVPSMLQAFVAHEGVNTCRKLKRIVCSGEALPADLANRTLEQLPGVGLYNLYGPTEAAIDVTHWTCRTGDEVVPIGRPIGNVSTHVLDAQMNLVPQGVAGELYLGGMGLARGYLNRATLTAERFVPDPFDANGGRLYRTGDLARWTNEGALEYLGRIDHQVKVRGLRIELGEIEAQLVAQAEVREAVVTAQEGPGGTRLIAYVTAHADHTVEQQALREALLRQLPDYMVPSAIMVLEALPLNPNGKVDRKALPVPEYQTRSYEPPQGETETSLAQIWSEVMGIEQVSRTDNFFELGGDSILIMKVATRIRSMTDFDVPLPMLFSHPTIAELAACISAATKPTAHIEPVPPLVPVARETGALPLSPAQRRVWIASQLAGPGSSAYNVSASVRLEGDISEARVAQALALLVGRQEVLRTSYPDRGGLPHAAISDAANADLVIRDLTAVPVDRHPAILRQIALERIDRPFDLACDALLRATLVRINGRQALLMLSVHHIVCDGWSMGVLVRDFCAFYAAGERAALPALPVQYVDYAAWHARVLDSARGEALKAFWRGELAGARSVLDLPADFPRPPAISDAGDSLHGTLDARLAQQVARFAREQRVTPFVVLLSAFQVLLHRLTGSRDVLVGTDVAGRTRVELEPLIGFFVNVVPLRLAMDDARTRVPVGELVARAHASAVAALEHQDLPFDQIAACAQVKRDAARNPLVQALFVLQNTPAAPIELPGVVAELIDLPASHSKFDMGLFINEGAGDWQVEWVFATALFRHATIQRWLDEWLRLVEDIVTQTEISVMGDAPAAVETTKPTTQAGAADKFAKLKKIASRGPRPAADARQAEGPARLSLLQPGRVMPVVLEPHSADVDPLAWAAQHRAFIEATLARHAVILFRNFRLPTPQAFEAFAEAMCPGLYGSYGDLPKKEGGKKTYRSTPYPEREMILYHNESAHLEQWPRKQWFFCELPSRVGGATPIVDCREMLRELPSEIVERFASAGLMYIRTFTDRLDVSWRDFFGTDERTEVERRLQVAGTAFNWLDNDGLQTRTLCPGVITHPVTGERCFFNQVQLHHPYFLKPEIHRDLLDMVGADYLPRNVCYGDGTAIDDTTMARIGEAYERCAVRFEWRKGDVVMLDNMLAAHARDPYEEPRKIVVAMGEMVSRASVADADAQRLEGADATRQE
ncbi:non-ribosomal peptide synthetase, partial [Paraburkholderia sp. J12]|uniref:non-ribosomal peptide synthetase n=1 Tax=Paraburkholderia sp. J12 TaxID=2805432 RepID=UPI002ABDD284